MLILRMSLIRPLDLSTSNRSFYTKTEPEVQYRLDHVHLEARKYAHTQEFHGTITDQLAICYSRGYGLHVSMTEIITSAAKNKIKE